MCFYMSASQRPHFCGCKITTNFSNLQIKMDFLRKIVCIACVIHRLTTETQPRHLLIIGNKNFHEMEYLFAFARLKEKVLKITLLGL